MCMFYFKVPFTFIYIYRTRIASYHVVKSQNIDIEIIF